MKFDEVANFWDLDYRGPAYGPLEIPDQVTLARAAEIVTEGDGPFLLVLPLISSHWPWEHVPRFIEEWEAIGRGEALEIAPEDASAGMADDPPEGDAMTLPPLYLETIRYSLRAAVQYVENAVGPDDIVLLVGDHPPAAFVTDDRAERGVPVHVIGAADALGAWGGRGFTRGFVPENAAEAPMSDVPRWLLGGDRADDGG